MHPTFQPENAIGGAGRLRAMTLRLEAVHGLLDRDAAHLDALQIGGPHAVRFRQQSSVLSHVWNGAVPRVARGL